MLAFGRGKEQNAMSGNEGSLGVPCRQPEQVFGICRRRRNRILPPTEAAIRRQLQSILTSPVFHGSRRCQQFLTCVCEKSLAGEAAALKERTIAIEVFGRQPESDLVGRHDRPRGCSRGPETSGTVLCDAGRRARPRFASTCPLARTCLNSDCTIAAASGGASGSSTRRRGGAVPHRAAPRD